MEVALAVVGVTDVAVRASSKLWTLSSAWRDAPMDLHNLRDDLTRTERFFREIERSLNTARLIPTPPENEPFGPRIDLGRLVAEGALALKRIEAIVDSLVCVADDSTNTKQKEGKTREIGKRKRVLWLRQSREIAKLREQLAHIRSSICRLLIAQNT